MNHNAYIGIDLGTSGCRAIAINDDQQIIATSEVAFSSQSELSPSQTEQDPLLQWSIVLNVLAELIGQCQSMTIQAIAVDATSGSILITDTVGQALSPILMYNDKQAVVESELISQSAPKDSGANGLGSGLSKLLYLQKQQPNTKACRLVHQVDWINFNLGGRLGVTDENTALKSGYDIINRCWPDWLNHFVATETLPTVVVPGSTIGQLSAALCRQFELSYAPKIVAGTTDSIAAFMATGANDVGDAVTSLGSTLVVKVLSPQPLFLPELGVYSHRFNDKWLVGGASNSGGAVLKYYFNNDELQRLSANISLSNEVEDYYPLLKAGERFPINDANLQPRLTPRPSDDVAFLHGLLNGIANIECSAYKLLEQSGQITVKSIRTVGGGSVNSVWQSLRQSKIKLPFIKPKYTDAAYGAALLAINKDTQ